MAVQATTNKDIDYIQKDFNSSVDAIITFANVNFGPGTSANRLWTNFNADSFSRNWLEIVAFIADVFFFYFDVQATQSYLQTATVRSAVKNIAKQFGFVPATATSASGNATFAINRPGTVLRGFRVTSSNGQQFYLTSDIVAASSGNYAGTVLQGIIKTEQFSAKGVQNEQFDLQGPNVVRDLTNLNPKDISPQVTVNGNSYTLVNTFISSNGTDLPAITDSLGNVIGGGGRVFIIGERPNGTPFLEFGDGIFGRKPAAGELITITYRTGGGSAGNIAKQTLTTLTDNNPIVSSVTNAADFSGGADEQTIDQLRELIPASLRTLNRAVAEQDYSDLLKATFTSVSAASTEKNTTDPGVDLNIYVVPTGLGITKISTNTILKNNLASFLDRRKMVTVQFQILDAFGISVLFSMKVFITDTSSKSTVSQAITTALTNFFSLTTGGDTGAGIGFAETILIKDLSAILSTISGIDRFEITRLTYRPRIAFNVLGLNTSYEASNVDIFPNVSESEWLLGASGLVTRTSGTVLFSNTGLTAYTYNSGTGQVIYAFPVNLNGVAPGDLFRDGSGTDFTIFAVDVTNSNLYLATGQTVNTTVSTANSGSIRSGATAFEAFKCFKKILANATNLSIDSITDNNLDLSVTTGTATAISATTLLDNSKIFVQNQYATGEFYLVDSAGNIWEILSNTSNTLKTSITAVNDASVTAVASGTYKIVTKLVGSQVVFNDNIFNIQFNSDKTIFSIGAQFSNIGTIGDDFQISKLQAAIGNLGIALDLISYDPTTKTIRLNNAPDLSGVSSIYNLVDSSGQVFNIVGVDNRSEPSTFYDATNQDSSFILFGAGLGQEYAQGFKVSANNVYSVVSWDLKRSGNIIGNLTAKIVNDDGTGLPNLASVVAVSKPVNVTSISLQDTFTNITTNPNTSFDKVIFSFTTPPTLNAGTQYHLVLSGDASYDSAQVNNTKTFDNISMVAYTYNSLSGVIQYASSVDLSNVSPGQYFRDGLGKLWQILAVDDSTDRVTLGIGLSVDTTSNADSGSIYKKDNIYVATDISSPTYADGKFAQYDGSVWANDTQGPVPNRLAQNTDAIFSVEGPKTITVDSNLTPVLGPLATTSQRYYDDNREVTFILGLSNGSITSATDVNAIGRGTVATIPNSKVDNFVFRTSRYADDIVNLRLNEIPQISASDISLEVFGGVD